MNDKRLLEQKTAAVQADRIRRLLAMSRAERRRNGVRLPKATLEALLNREEMRLSAP